MPIKATEGLAPEWYTPPGQGDGTPTRFKIRPLDGAEFGEIADYVSIDAGVPMIKAAGRDRCLKMALQEWENLEGVGGPVPFTPHNQRLIPHEVRVAIVNRVLVISTLGEELEKN
jgi:hypothetical protein